MFKFFFANIYYKTGFLILFNCALVSYFIYDLYKDKKTISYEFENKVKEELSKGSLLVKLIVHQFSIYDLDIVNINKYIEEVIPIIDPSLIYFNYLAAADEIGNVTYYYGNDLGKKYNISHRKYFNIAKKFPHVIHIGSPIIGMTSHSIVIPVSKMLPNKKKYCRGVCYLY